MEFYMKNDRELFKGTAYYYAKYRADYPAEFFDFVVRYFKLDGKGQLLDLGCGTGQLTIPFAKHFEEAVGLDPEKEMLEEAAKEADKDGVKNIKWVSRKAEEIADDLGIFRLTTMGASFHWMEREIVLRKIYDMTEKGGGLAIVSDFRKGNSPQSGEEWKVVRKKIIEKYLGEKRRAGNSFYEEPKDKFEDLLNRSPFGSFEEWTHSYTRTWTLEAVINFLYSTSFASQRLFGDKLNEFEEELKKELLRLEPNGVFTEQVRLQVLLARK